MATGYDGAQDTARPLNVTTPFVLLDRRTCDFTGHAKASVFVGTSVALVFPKPEYLQFHSGPG
jgi:hypothetical protein